MTDNEIKDAISKVDGLAGMTVNEKLWETGLMKEFDEARKNDKDKARRILEWVGVDKPSIEAILKPAIFQLFTAIKDLFRRIINVKQ